MKTFYTFADHFRLSGLCVGLAVSTFGSFVTETTNELITTADLDGDGRQDIVVVDKASGTFRAGYQFSDNNFTWSESRGLGGTNITGITTGAITDTSYDAIAAVSPFMNRVNLIEAPNEYAAAFPLPVFGEELGPQTIVRQEIGGGTAESDLVVINSMSSPYPNRLEYIESFGSSFKPSGAATLSDVWVRGNAVPFLGNIDSATFLDRSQNALRMFEFSSGSAQHLDSMFFGISLASPDYCPVYPVPGDYVHYMVWDPGTSLAFRFSMQPGESFSALDAVDFGGDIASIQTVNADGVDWLLVIYVNGDARIFYYDGSADPEFHHDLDATAAGIFYSAAVQTGPDRFTLLTADQETGQTQEAELVEFDGNKFQGSTPVKLPPVSPIRGRANVFTFRNEPFVDAHPQRLQALNAGDWSTKAELSGIPLEIGIQFETDQGMPDGLGAPIDTVLGYADINANHVLVNQAGNSYSVYSAEAALGYQWAEAFINPSPGHYRTGIEVTFSNSTGDEMYYRMASSNTWNFYTGSIPLFKEETILFYAEAPGGQRSPIQTAIYTFEAEPGALDSDGDTVPDHVELANGLNPITSGLDGDEDGFSDLEELLAGSDPADPGSVPLLPIPGTSGRLEQLSAFDLHVTLRPYDGTADSSTLSKTGTALRAFSGTGWQYAYDVASHHASAGITDPSVLLTNMPSTIENDFFTLLTDQHFPISTAFSNENIGIEMASVLIAPAFQSLEFPAVYSGGDLSAESAAWISAALTIVTNSSVPVVTDDLETTDVLKSMLTERKIMDELFTAGRITNRYATLFPGRPSDNIMLRASAEDFQHLRNRTTRAYLPQTIIAEIENYLSDTNSAALKYLTQELYAICSAYSDTEPGAYALPMTVLRNYLLSGNLNSNYAARVSYNTEELNVVFEHATNTLAAIAPRPVENMMLKVNEGSFSNACPVLFTGGGGARSLYDSEGRPYIMPFSFNLGAGAEVSAQAFTDVAWNRVPGTEPIEIISLSLTAVPVSSDTDSNGNLIPDALEENLLASPGSPAHLDSDGDGYSDLQEYLDGSDPSDPLNRPSGLVVDLSPPEVVIVSLGGGQVQLSIQWPVAYTEPFVFSAMYSDDLTATGFNNDHELAFGSLNTTINIDSSDARFYKVGIRLR